MNKITLENNIQHHCIVCNSTRWLTWPIGHSMRSVRSDGAILNQPLTKAQCYQCGLVQSAQLPDTNTLATLYTEKYDIYNNRPNAEQFVASRYAALSNAFTGSVAPYQPRRVLEVGCGNGATLNAVQSIWTNAMCIGIEPVVAAVEEAKRCGFNVHQGMIGVSVPPNIASQKYDVIYAVHVIEHTQNPIEFLLELKKMLTTDGFLILSCPNACMPNFEMMRADHHYSMTPYHLEIIARKSGLIPTKNTLCPGGSENLDDEHNQLLVCRLAQNTETQDARLIPMPFYLNEENRIKLFKARQDYFYNFEKLDSILQSKLKNIKRLFCFGTGGWACMLAGYAPQIWNTVQACIIDGNSDKTFYGKPIYSFESLKSWRPDGIIIGTNPAIQTSLAQRINKDGYNAIRWSDIVAM